MVGFENMKMVNKGTVGGPGSTLGRGLSSLVCVRSWIQFIKERENAGEMVQGLRALAAPPEV